MKLVYKFNIKQNEQLTELCKISKNLYNQALYIIRQELDKNKKWLGYYDIDKIMQKTTNLDGEINYRLLKAQVSQQCLRQLDANVKAYVKSIKDYSKHKEKYNGCPRFPRYKKEMNMLIYTNQSASIKDGCLYLSKTLAIKIPQFEKYKDKIEGFQQVRLIPKIGGGFTCEIVYNGQAVVNEDLDYTKYASIDLGVDNLVTMVYEGGKPILFNGRQVKSKNRFFNKEIGKLKSQLGKNAKSSKRIRKLWEKRENQLNDVFHKLSRQITNMLNEKGIGNIVVGYNKGWKDSINIGKRNNQTFVAIPYEKLIGYLRYKCELCGINLILTEEGYTSKCDSLCFESMERHDKYLGKRVKRGLFQSSSGKLLNADVNGALNILRKVVGDSETVSRITDSGWLFQPLRVNVI